MAGRRILSNGTILVAIGEEFDIRKQIESFMNSVKMMIEGKEARIGGMTAMHLHNILDSVEAITYAMDEEWVIERSNEEQKAFLNQKVHEKTAFREIRMIIHSMADLIQCKQQKYYAERQRRKREKMIKKADEIKKEDESDNVSPCPSSGYLLRTNLKKKNEVEPQNEIVAEIKVEPMYESYPKDLQPFVLPESIPDEKIPKLEEPEVISFGFPSTSKERDEEISSKERGRLEVDCYRSHGILPRQKRICHFCSIFTDSFHATPSDPIERRAFLINLHCQWQHESNAREVLLCSSKQVYFCSKHIKMEYAEMIKFPGKRSNDRLSILPVRPVKRRGNYNIKSPADHEKEGAKLDNTRDADASPNKKPRARRRKHMNHIFPDYPCITTDPHQ